MTNAELIQKIRNEIERRYNYEKEMYCDTKPDGRPNNGWAESLAIMGVLEELLSFLSTLESEKPMQEGLDEEINRLWESFADEMDGPHNLFDIYARLARHFAQWGAEHIANPGKTSSDNSEIPNDLKEAAAEEYPCEKWMTDFMLDLNAHKQVAFWKGAKWHKEQMMKEAVECELYYDGDFLAIDLNMEELGYSERDKVRIIILPKKD